MFEGKCMLILLWSVIQVASTYSCLQMRCVEDSVNGLERIDCDKTAKCLQQHSRFYLRRSGNTCFCSSAIPTNCAFKYASNSSKVTAHRICFLSDLQLPPIEVHSEGRSSISVTVPRFFEDEAISAVYNFTYLKSYTRFNLKNNESSDCETIGNHIVARHETRSSSCLYATKLSIPGVDGKTDNHYYYDDRTALETEFAKFLFADAELADFWYEVTVTHSAYYGEGASAHFSQVVRSPLVRFRLQRAAAPTAFGTNYSPTIDHADSTAP